MGEPTRGQDTTLEFFDSGGNILNTINCQSANINPLEEKSSQQRVGERLEQPRQTFSGWEGEVTFEEEGPVLEDIVDAQQDRYFAGQPVDHIDVVVTTYYVQTGITRTYVYPDAVFSVSRSISGKNDPNSNTLSFRAAQRIKIG